MKKIDKYEKILMKFDSIIFGKLELSAQAKMSLYLHYCIWNLITGPFVVSI